MTVGELKAILKDYSDDMKVKITYECDNDYREISDVGIIRPSMAFISITSKEVPTFDDLTTMAYHSFVEYEKDMSETEVDLMRNFIGEENL